MAPNEIDGAPDVTWLLPAFHFALGAAGAAALVRLRDQPTLERLVSGLVGVATVAILTTVILFPFFVSDHIFGVFRLIGIALFGHLPIGLAAAAATLHRATPRVATSSLVLAMVLWAIAIYAYRVEPFRLEVSHHEVQAPGLKQRLRVAIVADLQTDRVGEHERRALEATLASEPDLILLPGDYVHVANAERRARAQSGLRELLTTLDFDAPLGVFAVRGDVETDDWQRSFDGLPVRTFEHSTRLDLGQETGRDLGLTLTALTPESSRHLELRVPPSEGFHLVFGHAPDYALSPGVAAGLLIAGHTHGGQVRLPWVGPLLTLSRVPRAWAAGRTELPNGRTLLVSRGIGLERGWAPRLRFLCRPEVVVIDLLPAAQRSRS